MAGLIVAGYDAVHKQGQVKHPSLDYNFSSGQDDICSSLSQFLRVFCGTNKSSTKHPLPPGVVCANWRHVRASADDYWWLWILLPLWHDGPHIQGELYFLCHHLVHLFDFFRIICPRKSARIWFCRLLPRFIPNSYYDLKQLNSLMQRFHGSYIINRSAGNQERRQLWRMLQDGNYHQGESVKL